MQKSFLFLVSNGQLNGEIMKYVTDFAKIDHVRAPVKIEFLV